MTFTTTMLFRNTLEYGKKLGSQLSSTRIAIRWATDCLLKCATATPGSSKLAWVTPMLTTSAGPRGHGHNEVCVLDFSEQSWLGCGGETEVALATASMVFGKVDPNYSSLLLKTAKKVMQFALQYRGAYSDSLDSVVCPFYCSYSGYNDELMWGAAWLFRATNDISYNNFLKSLVDDSGTDIFSWDNKYAGGHVLLARVDYVLGVNPIKMSYMFGFGPNFPRRIHHRGFSLASLSNHPQNISCDGGFQPFFYSSSPNPNILVRAIVRGPNQNDGYPNDRGDYSHLEPATYINAAIVGPSAYFFKKSF